MKVLILGATGQVGRAFIKIAVSGYQKVHLENSDLNSI
jgi:uncharacterized protein YbjT (DUF2867 family)